MKNILNQFCLLCRNLFSKNKPSHNTNTWQEYAKSIPEDVAIPWAKSRTEAKRIAALKEAAMDHWKNAEIIRASEYSQVIDTLDENKFYKRKGSIHSLVFHWNGGDVSAKTLIKRLKTRNHFYDFVIDKDGTIYKLNPNLMKYASKHVRGNNHKTIGICLVGPGYKTLAKGSWDWVHERIHDNTRLHMVFTKAQKESAAAVLKQYSRLIKFNSPITAQDICLEQGVVDNPLSYTVTGHFHFQKNRRDPGLDLLYYLRFKFDA